MGILKPSLPLQERKPLSFWRKVKTPSPARGQAAVEFETPRVLTAEAQFVQALSLERKRAERSGQPFLLILLEGVELLSRPRRAQIATVTDALGGAIRETDLCGWYRQNRTLGVIFTEVNPAEVASTVKALKAKVEGALRGWLKPAEAERMEVSIHLFPEPGDGDGWRAPDEPVLCP